MIDQERIKSSIGSRLRQLRGRRSQSSFARIMDTSQQTVSKNERGEIPENWLFLARLREREGVDLNELLSPRSIGSDRYS